MDFKIVKEIAVQMEMKLNKYSTTWIIRTARGYTKTLG